MQLGEVFSTNVEANRTPSEVEVQRNIGLEQCLTFSLAEESKVLQDALWAAQQTAQQLPNARIEVRTVQGCQHYLQTKLLTCCRS